MSKAEPKKVLPEAEMKARVEKAIAVYKTTNGDVRSLYNLIDVLNDVHNEACRPGQEMAWMLSWVASFPDN